jgi:chromosomal replication initiation ATPase DnaA
MDRWVHILNRRGIEVAEHLIVNNMIIHPKQFQENTQRIVNIICDYYNVDVDIIMKGTDRFGANVLARQMAIHFVCSSYPNLKNHIIGELFNRHRCTIIYAKGKIEDMIQVDKQIKKDYHRLCRRIDLMYKGQQL